MMKRQNVLNRDTCITGLDIGTSKVSVVSAQIGRSGAFKVLAHDTMPSRGLARGAFLDLNEPTEVVAKILAKIRAKTGKRPTNVYVNISGEAVKASRSRGMIPLTLRGREVTKADIERCVDVASTIHLPFDREIIHKVVQNFSIDDQAWIKSPLGLYASRLAAEVYIITASVNHIQNIYKCVNNAGFDVKEIVFSGMADGAALLDATMRDEGALLLDMGASVTEAAVFSGGGLVDMDIIPVGSQDVKGGQYENEAFKMLLARSAARLAPASGGAQTVKHVVITGGLAFEDGIVEALEAGIGRPVTVGRVKEVTGDISSLDALRLATAIGLCRYAYEKYEKKAREDRDVVKRLSTKVVDLFNSYF